MALPASAAAAHECLLELSASMEDYLEAIYELERSERVARVKDIAERLSVAPPSVSGALKALKEKGLVHHESYSHVTLTPAGLQAAEQILRRHEVVVRLLHGVLQLPREQAEVEACLLEHAVSAETLQRLRCLVEFVETCPRAGEEWLARLATRWSDAGCTPEECRKCVGRIEVPEPRAREETTQPPDDTLAAKNPGWRGVVRRLAGRGPLRRRLLEMGITAGSHVEVERIAPLGDPVEVKIRGYHLSLRKEEAANVYVESL